MTHLEMTDEQYQALQTFADQWRGSEGAYYADVDIHDIGIIIAAVRAIDSAAAWEVEPAEVIEIG
jgi:hypothetical protein